MDLLSRNITDDINYDRGRQPPDARRPVPAAQASRSLSCPRVHLGPWAFPCPVLSVFILRIPGSKVIAIDGDGSIKMNMGEIHTIGSFGMPIKVLMLNNHADGMVRTIQAVFYNRQFTGSERNFDANFSQIAKECGFTWCRKIRSGKNWSPPQRVSCCRGPVFPGSRDRPRRGCIR